MHHVKSICPPDMSAEAQATATHVRRTKSEITTAAAKPVAIAPRFDGIAAEMREAPRWVLWQHKQTVSKRGIGRWTKVPVNLRTRRNASSTNPATWGTFQAAHDAYAAGGFDGVGFMLGDGWIGIDFDDVRDPDTGEIDADARDVIARLGSYCEVSPSGTGVKVFGRGSLPPGAKHKLPFGGTRRLELYDAGRYFTVTGVAVTDAPVGDIDPTVISQLIAECGEAVPPEQPPPEQQPPEQQPPEQPPPEQPPPEQPPAAQQTPKQPTPATDDDQRILDRIAESANGEKFRRVLAGNFSDYNDDESDAHLGLCNAIVAQVGPDHARVLRVLSLIPVATRHPKWGRHDYWQRTIDKAIRDARGKPGVRPSDCTDVANARRLVAQYGDRLRYCGAERSWYVYDDESGVWAKDEADQRVEHFAKKTSQRMLNDAARDVSIAREVNDTTAAKDAETRLNWAVATQKNGKRILTIPRLARSSPGLRTSPADFDADPWLLNTLNGVVDLTSGKPEKHKPGFLMTKCVPTPFVPDATSPTWERFISDIFKGDAELVRWVQRFFGYCLSGDTSIQLLPVLWGSGSNGKSKFHDTLLKVVGGYWSKAAPELLLKRQQSAHPTELADLRGLRLAFSVETDDGRKLNESRVKEITGDDTLKARRMREDFYEFARTNKTVLVTNHKPRVETGGHGIWRRVALVPFTQRYWNADKGESGPPELKADSTLSGKLLAESRGILAWLVRGAVDCYRDGLQLGPCKAVAAATAEYQAGEDTFAQFVAEKLRITPGGTAEVNRDIVFAAHQSWYADNNAKPLTKRKLTDLMLEHGVGRRESNGQTIYVGVEMLRVSTEGSG